MSVKTTQSKAIIDKGVSCNATIIKLTNHQFDHFVTICDKKSKLSKVILSAAKRLDDNGLTEYVL